MMQYNALVDLQVHNLTLFDGPRRYHRTWESPIGSLICFQTNI